MPVGGARPGAGRKPGVVSAAKRELQSMAKDHAERALQVLAEVMESAESDAARVAAANAILDRGYGKPVTMTANVTDHLDALDDDSLAAALAAVRAAIGAGEADQQEAGSPTAH